MKSLIAVSEGRATEEEVVEPWQLQDLWNDQRELSLIPFLSLSSPPFSSPPLLIIFSFLPFQTLTKRLLWSRHWAVLVVKDDAETPSPRPQFPVRESTPIPPWQ